jgi:PAS domain S-box-containing protein
MVPVAGPRLTRIGFRRDIKFFLAALVGFLIVLILALVLLMQTMLDAAQSELRGRWKVSADAATAAIERSAGSDLQSALIFARNHYGIDGIEASLGEGMTISSGLPSSTPGAEAVRRTTSGGTLTMVFDAAPMQSLRRRFVLTASICFAAAIAGAVLLLFYLPRITRPVERMLDQASALAERAENVDEEHYLIETFKASIARLHEQEGELKRLHEVEKNRADELQLITATLTRSLTSGFVAINSEGRIVDVNGAAREILRLSPDEISGKTIEEAFGRQEFSEELQRALHERRTVSRREIAYRCLENENDNVIVINGNDVDIDDNGPVVIGLTTVPLIGEGGAFLGVIALFADLTHVRTLEARLREMQTLADLGEISAGIAHEFRNSLSTILGYLKLARRDELPHDASHRVRNAEEEAAELSRAVEALLNFARPMQAEFQPVDLADVAREVTDRLRSSTEGVRWELDLEAAPVQGDRTLLCRAVENLVRNSIDAIGQMEREAGTITVRTRSGPRPTLAVEDDGAGIDPAEAPRLLLPFQSGKPTGMGLGLPLARKIALLHGGTLRLTGDRGKGAAVTLEFFDPPENSAGTPAASLPRLQRR